MGTEASNIQVVRAYVVAVCSGQFEKLRGLLHENLSFKGPMETIAGADAFIDTVKRHLGPIVKGAEIHKELAVGDRVVLTYDFVTNSPAGKLPMTEWYEVKNGKVSAIELFFDPRPLMALMK